MKKLSLNRNQIKYIIIVAMLIDHIAWSFVPTESVLGQVMHFIGRLTGPCMAYFIAEGYQHTRNVKKYACRLGIFALISWTAYVMESYHSLPIRIVEGVVDGRVSAIKIHIVSSNITILFYPWFGVIYSLFLSLLAVWLWDKAKCAKWCKILAIIGLCVLSFFGDWPVVDIVIALFMFCYRDNPKSKWIAFYCIATVSCIGCILTSGNSIQYRLFQLGVFLPVILLQNFYNGESGSKKPIHKWFFYIFYPAHLLIIALIKGGIRW